MAEPELPPHRTLVDVRFREVDSYGVAWHGHFVDWLEVARHRFAAHFGFDAAEMQARGIRLPMLELSIEYRHALRFGDRVAIDVAVVPDPRKVVTFEYRLTRLADGKLVARARTTQVVQGADGTLRLGWPAALRPVVDAMRDYEAARAGAAAASGSDSVKRVP